MSEIIQPEVGCAGVSGISRAEPPSFKYFWPEVKNTFYFRSRRAYLDLLRNEDGKLFYISGTSAAIPPFILIGKWRDRDDIAAIWHLKARGDEKRRLVLSSAKESLCRGTKNIVTKLLNQEEAEEFSSWGFETICRIVLLEKPLYEAPKVSRNNTGARITNFRKRDMEEVLKLDAAAFDNFWKLDAHTLGIIASSCTDNAFILARKGKKISGYAVGGVSGGLGYLQRLGVEPDHQGSGLGKLLASGITKLLYRMGASLVLVNTQEDNQAALKLYRDLGFLEKQGRKHIMQYPADMVERSGW